LEASPMTYLVAKLKGLKSKVIQWEKSKTKFLREELAPIESRLDETLWNFSVRR